MFIGVLLLIPASISIFNSKISWLSFFIPSTGIFAVGGGLFLRFQTDNEPTLREGYGIVSFAWILIPIIGAIPYSISGVVPNFASALFESASGFTGTGSSIFARPEILPKSILFWRSLTQWIGGAGVVILSLAILPFLRLGGAKFGMSDSIGVSTERLLPRVKDSLNVFLRIYLLATLLIFSAMLLTGASMFDSLCHSLGALSTSRFSNHADNIGFFNYTGLHWLIILAMFVASTNYSLHQQALRGNLKIYFKNEEFLVFVGLLIGVSFFLYISNGSHFGFNWTTFKSAVFHTISYGSSTGFTLEKLNNWPSFSQFLIYGLMWIGGCSGSTAGGFKIVRLIIVFKAAFNQIFQLIHPKGVRSVIINKLAVPHDSVKGITGMLLLSFSFILIFSFTLTIFNFDLVQSFSLTISSFFNVAPPPLPDDITTLLIQSPPGSKVVLSFLMILGRLETLTFFVLLFPSTWRK